MIRVLNRFLTLPESSSKRNVQLIFANKTERDIAMRTELDNLAKEYKWSVYRVISYIYVVYMYG